MMVLLRIMCVLILANVARAQFPSWAVDFLAKCNKARAEVGVAPLCLVDSLMKASTVRSQYLRSKGDALSHIGPNQPWDRAAAAGYKWSSVAENLASASVSAQQAFDLFINEKPPNDGHRRNILNPKYQHMGIGGIDQSDIHKGVWVQMFGSSSSAHCSYGSLPEQYEASVPQKQVPQQPLQAPIAALPPMKPSKILSLVPSPTVENVTTSNVDCKNQTAQSQAPLKCVLRPAPQALPIKKCIMRPSNNLTLPQNQTQAPQLPVKKCILRPINQKV